jgi:hypothetical protein
MASLYGEWHPLVHDVAAEPSYLNHLSAWPTWRPLPNQ